MNGSSLKAASDRYESFPTLQYMGSKLRMLQNICEPIASEPGVQRVIDAFAGTGTIAYALRKRKKVISNDLEYYAYVINQAILNGCSLSSEELEQFCRKAGVLCNRITEYVDNMIRKEEFYLNGNGSMEEYAAFVRDTPSVFSAAGESGAGLYAPLQQLVQAVHPEAPSGQVPFPCLFLTYYANTYFGVRQSCCIDALRACIDELPDERQRYVMLTALMSAMSQTASTTTHFAQYLKVNSAASYRNLIKKRRTDIMQLTLQYIGEFEHRGLLQQKEITADCRHGDFADCLKQAQLDENTLVYADPPYFKEHYSRYYHLLNTLCLYDYPLPDINPQRNTYSIGRYRTGRQSSDFGKKAKALAAFERLISLCAAHRAKLVMSYSENSIISIEALKELASRYYDVHIESVSLKHSKQGRLHSGEQEVNEYVFFCRPKNVSGKTADYYHLQTRITEIKPQVDNPGGLIHNYMARKPYNIVAGLIEELTQPGDVVCDPMFGSGTTIIEAVKAGRNAVGCDINPIAYKIASVSLNHWDMAQVSLNLASFVDDIEKACEQLYTFEHEGETRILERCHFNQEDDGTLTPTSYWYKVLSRGRLSGRRKEIADASFAEQYQSLKTHPLHSIEPAPLLHNSRIAIKKGATTFDYLCFRNRVALDVIISTLRQYRDKGVYGKEIMEVIVSSAINLIKLSDKKASSQVPYWIPKKDVTSRNAVMVLRSKAEAMVEGVLYLQEQCRTSAAGTMGGEDAAIRLYNKPAQDLTPQELPDETVDMILTDPPYADQVPYLEYSQLWNLLLAPEQQVQYKQELVVSDAPERQKDFDSFCKDFRTIIRRSVHALKQGGHFVMFYHSFDLAGWAAIDQTMRDAGLSFRVQFPSPSARRSFKAVTSPKCTLDGNYIIIYQKEAERPTTCPMHDIEDVCSRIIRLAADIIRRKGEATTQELYDEGLLNDAIKEGYIALLALHFSSFTTIIKDHFTYHNGYWRM